MKNISSIFQNILNKPLTHRSLSKFSGKTVFVGMSGGVDSSVSAALLKEQGYDVTGVFIKVWQPDWDIFNSSCTWREDRLDAMRVCAHLGIPFITLDLSDEYKREVVDFMIEEYRKGRTPNPDVMCNRYVKFGGFFDWAIKNGADFVATGHYAFIEKATERTKDATKSDKKTTYKLMAGNDPLKDQSYFLWTLTQEQLSKTIFPVGKIEKKEVRELAKRFQLPTALKKDSQGLCFIGKIDIKDFLKHYIEEKPGKVFNDKGEEIGTHSGAFFFTKGERHGFTISQKTNVDKPYYVVEKNIENNTLVVSNKNEKGELAHGLNTCKVIQESWTSGMHPEFQTKYLARSRYRETLQEIIFIEENTVLFKKTQDTLSPGQSLVVYTKEGECLGGGIIA